MSYSTVLTRFREMTDCQCLRSLFLLFLFVLWGGWLHCPTVADHHGPGCRSLTFVKPVDGFALQGHVIENISLHMPHDNVRFECRILCNMESTCVSINIGLPANDGVSLCQLSDSDHNRYPQDLKPQEGFLYWATRNPCASDPCLHNATCLNGFTDKRYICLCQVGYTGEHCETADVCQNYQTLSDAERKETYVTVSAQCDGNLNGWYRFQGAAGTQMAVTCPSVNRCGGNFPGWLSNGHPTVFEGLATRRVCFNKGNCCADMTDIQLKNCGSYYIYKLFGTPGCNNRYCGTD